MSSEKAKYKNPNFFPKDREKEVVLDDNLNSEMTDAHLSTSAKIIWMKSMDYEIDTHILPVINLPHKGMFCQTHLTYKYDDTLTINDGIYDYVFARDFSDKKNDTLIRAFMTQLILDHIIRNI
jgi:hypothetical protein